MPRKPREVSESGFYHITQRGNAHALIFESDDDRKIFLRFLKALRDEMRFRVLAWCLMDDHIHLVIDAVDCDISSMMHLLERRYVSYFNRVHGREGHLFQGPFFSRPILSDAQLAATVQYVHQNPEKARICPMREYRWSSIQEYAGKQYLVDTSMMLGYFGSFEDMLAFAGDPENIVLSYGGVRSMSDAAAKDLAIDLLGDDALQQLRSGERCTRDHAIMALAANRVPKRQIARLAALGVNTVAAIVKDGSEGT